MIALPLTRGQRLWLVPGLSGLERPRYVTVVRLGTKWAYLDTYDGQRVNIETGELSRVDDGWIGKLYASQEEHADLTSVRDAWDHLSRLVRERSMFGRMPQGLTYERIEKARKLLNLEAP